MREWVNNRKDQGAYHQLLQELRLTDTSSYRNFLQMDAPTFDELLHMVESRHRYMCKLALTLIRCKVHANSIVDYCIS